MQNPQRPGQPNAPMPGMIPPGRPPAQHPAAQHPAAQHPAAQHPPPQHPPPQHPPPQHPPQHPPQQRPMQPYPARPPAPRGAPVPSGTLPNPPPGVPPPSSTPVPSSTGSTSGSGKGLVSAAGSKSAMPTTSQHVLLNSLPKVGPEDFQRLRELGFSDEEIQLSRAKLAELVRAVDPNVVLSNQVEEALLLLSNKIVESAAKFGFMAAQHRDSKTLEFQDLQIYVEKVLGIHVAGSGSTLSGNLPATYQSNTLATGNPAYVPPAHAATLNSKKKAREAGSTAGPPAKKAKGA